MRAGAYIDNGTVGVIDVEEPGPPRSDEVQIDVAYCGVCGTDLHMAEFQLFPPNCVMGHEFSGTVRALGDNVRTLDVGFRAAVLPFCACGNCRYCEEAKPQYCNNLLGIGTGHLPGGLAPRINVPASALVRLPDEIGLEHGALVEPLAVGLHAVRESGLDVGSSTAILGAGPIGIATLIAAKASGAGPIIVSERSETRAKLAEAFGADVVLLEGKDDVRGEVDRLTNGGADVVFECVGVPGTLSDAVMLGKKGARIQIVGVCFSPDTVIPAFWLLREPVIQVCFGYTREDFVRTVDMIRRGKADVDRMLSRVESVDQVAAVFEDLGTKKTDVKVLLKPIA